MQIKNLYKPFEIGLLEADSYIAQEHKNTYFEMVYILDGKGIQIINNHQLAYGPNKLFLLFPRDTHGFVVTEITRFFFLRFNESYLRNQPKEWLQKLEYIFFNHNHLPGCILKNIADKQLVRALVDALLREQDRNDIHQMEVMQQLLNTIITIAARNIAMIQSAEKYYPAQPLSLLGYVHQNIYAPEALTIEKFAAQFNLSPNYVSEYFKRQTGESLQQYITAYKLQLIENRLLHTSYRLSEIATEFGLTDVSHLNKLFKKHKGISPSAFRRNLK